MKKGKTLLEMSGFHFVLNEVAIGYFNIMSSGGDFPKVTEPVVNH